MNDKPLLMGKFHSLKSLFWSTFEGFFHYDGISEKQGRRILIGILLLVFTLRLLTIHIPALDRTDWKEIDHIMISKNFQTNGYNLLEPTVWWPAEEPRITAVELPLVAFISSLLYPVIGFNALSVRLITLLAFLLLVVYMYKLVKRETSIFLALLTAFFVGLLPMFSLFRNYLFSEPLMIFLAVFSIYQFAEWVEKAKKLSLIKFLIAFSIAISLKPTVLCIGLPLLWIYFRNHQWQIRQYLLFALVMGACLMLPALWYWHAYHLATNYIDVFGVFGGQFGGHDKFQTLTMLSKPWWYATIYWNLKIFLLGEVGLACVAAGVWLAVKYRKGQLFIAYLLAIISFFIIVAEGNWDTSYRQLTIIPPASFFLVIGMLALLSLLYTLVRVFLGLNREKLTWILAGVIFLGLFSVFPIRKKHAYPVLDKNQPMHEKQWLFAQEIRKVAKDDSKIILAGEYTIHKGGNDVSPVTYYYSGVQGWTIQEGEWSEAAIDSLKTKGADLFGAIDYTREPELENFLKIMSANYEVLYTNPKQELLLIRLQ